MTNSQLELRPGFGDLDNSMVQMRAQSPGIQETDFDEKREVNYRMSDD